MPSRRVIDNHIDAMFGEDPRTALVALRAFVESDLPWLERRTIRLARRRGYSWARMAGLLGRTRQGLRQRFMSIDGTWEPPDLQRVEHGEKMGLHWKRLQASLEEKRYLEEWAANGDVVPW
jgi:hypothetical protein